MVLIVQSQAVDDELGLETLVGEYTEVGTNHEKKFFKRTKVPEGVQEQAVFLYFWDKRDGADFAGWWFGDQVGGSQVWSRCETDSPLPPKSGWRIPWDGPVQADLVVEQMRTVKSSTAPSSSPGLKDGAAKKEKEEDSAEDSAATQAEADERVQRATDRVVIAEIEATQALESARAMLEGEVTRENLKVVDELLLAQLNALTEANKVLAADIIDARKSSPRAVAALSKLSPRIRSVQASIAQEMKGAKQLFARKQQEQEDRAKRKAEEEKLMLAEQRDAKALEDALPEAMEAVTQAEELFDVVVAAANPLTTDVAEEMNEYTSSAIKETEVAVVKAQTGIKQAKAHLNQKIAAAKNYAPEARKVALAELNALQDKLNEIQKNVTPYMRVRKDFEQKLEGKRILAEVAHKVGEAELEVEKLVTTLSGVKPSSDDLSRAEAGLAPAMSVLGPVLKFVESKVQAAQGMLKNELEQMLERAQDALKKVENFKVQLRSQMEGLQIEAILKEGLTKVTAAEEALIKCSEAEGLFAKGVEHLPAEEASAAISTCKGLSQTAESCVLTARSFFKAKQVVIRCFPEASRQPASEEMSQLSSRIEAVGEKLAKFQAQTSTRETHLLLREVLHKVKEAEEKLQTTALAAAPLSNAPEEQEIERLRTATEQTLEAEKTAAVACADARKSLMTKMKEGKVVDSQSYQTELQKAQSRLNAMQQELSKHRKVALQGEKLWRGMAIVQEKDVAMKAIEEEVEKAEILTAPLGDERPSDDHIREMDAAVNVVQGKVSEVVKSLEALRGTLQGSAKSKLTAVLDRAKVAQGRIDEMKETTREQRERLHCSGIIEQAKAKLDAVDELFKRVAEAEVPYLKGIEVLPLEEATRAVADCDAAAAEVHKGITEARAFMIENEAKVKSFVESVSKGGIKELHELAKRGDQASEKLASFNKDMDARRKVMQHQMAAAKVAEAEEAVKKMTDAALELSQKEEQTGAGDISAEAAHEMCEHFAETERAAQDKVESAKQFLLQRQREGRRERKGQDEMQEITKLITRVGTLQVDLAKAKATASEHEQKFVAKMLMQEASENIKALESDIDKVSEESAPLLVEGGKRFIVASMTRMVIEALKDYMTKNSLSYADLFAKIAATPTDTKVTEAEFTAFLEKVPDLLSRPDLAFSAEQRTAMFQQVDADADGGLTKDDFVEMFHDRYVCINSISITDGFDIDKSKTVVKLEVDDIVQTLSEIKTHESLGMMRVEVRTLKDGTRGWVTMQGNQGKVFLSLYTPYASYIKSLDKVYSAARSSASKVNEYISAKTTELSRCEKGPLAEAKSEFGKLRPKVAALQSKLDSLRKKIEEGKREHSKREEVERRKMEEKKERKAASLILGVITEKVDAAEAGLKKLEDVAGVLIGGSDLSSVADPLGTLEAAKSAASAMESSCSDAKTCLQNHEVKVGKAVKGPWFEAKQDMKKLKQRVLAAEKRSVEVVQSCQEACDTLAEAKSGMVASALRASVQARGITTEALFGELADAEETVSQEALFKYLDGLKDFALTPQHRRLLFKGSATGLTRRAFFAMVERYFRCVREIAITKEFEINASSHLRKIALSEIVEVIEGPKSDEGLGVMRVRARALSDGTIGWITATGNHGTPFLVDTPKPCLYVAAEVCLQDDFPSESSAEIRNLRASEVVEILEGPRKEVVGNAMRARGKAVSDGAIGWFTTKSKSGVDCVRPGSSTYVCTSNIALTDGIDIKECKVIRKLSKGEGLTVLEGPVEDEKAGVPRIKARAASDGAEGWVSIRGNAGSVYAEESGRQVIVCRSMPLQGHIDSDARDAIRTLAEEEVLDILEGPVEEIAQPPQRYRVRVATDGKVGWVTFKDDILLPWSPQYRCTTNAALHSQFKLEGATSVRTLEPGELVELIEGPRLEASLGVLRMRGRATKDGAVGWVTIAGNQGTPFFTVVPPE